MNSFNERKIKSFFFAWVMFCFFALCSCGEGFYSPDDGNLSNGKGSYSFSIKWPDGVPVYDSEPLSTRAIDCDASRVATIEFAFFDENDELLIRDSWECNLHTATADGIPAGKNRRLVVTARSNIDSDLYQGEKTGITIINGGNTQGGIVELTALDPVRPIITVQPHITNITENSAAIYWETDEPSDSIVRYDTAHHAWENYFFSGYEGSFVTNHSIELVGLQPGQTYFFRIGSADESNNGPTISYEFIAETEKAYDTLMPVITSLPTLSGLSASTATIAWTTDEPSDSVVTFSVNPDLSASIEATVGNLVTGHSVTIYGLTADTEYFYRAGSTDKNGNGPAYSTILSFTTAALIDTNAPIIVSAPTAVYASEISAVIQWKTNEPATSDVEYGLTSAYGSVEALPSYTFDHSVTLTGLTPDTIYHFRVSSTDAQGNGPLTSATDNNPSVDYTFRTEAGPDTTPPQFVSPPTVISTNSSSVIVTWSTNEPSNSQVQYGGTSNAWGSYSSGEIGAEFVSSHSVELTGLSGSTMYYFRVGSTDLVGNGPSVSNEFSFVTSPDPDITVPIIYAVSVDYTTNDMAAIEWITNEPANGNIEYGTTPLYGQIQTVQEYKKNHKTALTNLNANTTYYFRVRCVDPYGNGPTYSNGYQFITTAVPDTESPILISSPTVTSITNDSAVVEWSTNEPGNSQVQYGTVSAAWGTYPGSKNDAGMMRNHSVTITGLSGNTAYYFRVGSTDAVGNGPSTSTEVRFITEPDPDVIPPVITMPPTVTGITDTSAIIEWTTNEPSNSQVRYALSGGTYTWDSYPLVESVAEMKTDHIVILTGLASDTAYYFRAGSTDASGNGPAASFEIQFATSMIEDETAPRIVAGPVVTSVDNTSAIVEWETDEPSNSVVEFDQVSNIWGSYPGVKSDATIQTKHLVIITGLLPSTVYYYRVGSTDTTGNGPEMNHGPNNPSSEDTLVTTAVVDSTPPVMSGGLVSWVTNQTALIEWQTNEPADSQVQYGTSSSIWGAYNYFENQAKLSLNHAVTITGLVPDTLYYYRVASSDWNGNLSSPSPELTFVTNSGPDLTAPQISNVTFQTLSASTAVVSWRTNEPANSQVRYDIQNGQWDTYAFRKNIVEMVIEHSVTLTGLSPDTRYFLRVSSTDASGNDHATSINDANPSVEYTLSTVNAVPPSILVYPNPLQPKIDYAQNRIDISFDKINMQGADVANHYQFLPALSIDAVQLIGSTEDSSTYRMALAAVPQNTIFSMTVTSDITDVDGYPVKPRTVVINDQDGDELPDNWEVAVGLDPENAEATTGQGWSGDYDSDGYSNYEEFVNSTDPTDANDYPVPAQYLEAIPHDGAGISDSYRVTNNASFAVMIADSVGVDVTNTSAVAFTVNDGTQDAYTVDLSDPDMRIVKLTQDGDTALTKFWAVYDRSMSTYGVFPYSATVSIGVSSVNTRGFFGLVTYKFEVESSIAHTTATTTLPDFSAIGTEDPDVSGVYDAGLKVNSGDLVGAKIIYNSAESIAPTFGPTAEIPTFDLANSSKVGVAMNLQPPTVFSTPVKLILPAPGIENTSNVRIYMFDGKEWVVGCDCDELDYKKDWYVPGSRLDGNQRIEFKVYHFSGVQLGIIN